MKQLSMKYAYDLTKKKKRKLKINYLKGALGKLRSLQIVLWRLSQGVCITSQRTVHLLHV